MPSIWICLNVYGVRMPDLVTHRDCRFKAIYAALPTLGAAVVDAIISQICFFQYFKSVQRNNAFEGQYQTRFQTS